MTLNNWVWDVVGWAALVIVAVLIMVFLYRRFVSELPLFFLYLLVTEAVAIARIVASHVPSLDYHNVYWATDSIYTFFALAATFELFIKRLFPGFYKIRFYRYIFLVAAGITTVSTIMIALISGHDRMLVVTVYVYHFVRAAILIFFVALMMFMGRQWHKPEFAIAAGFGLDVSMSLAALGVWARTPEMTVLIGQISAIVYVIACLIWLYCFLTVDKVSMPSSSAALPQGTLGEARKWETTLKDFLNPGKHTL